MYHQIDCGKCILRDFEFCLTCPKVTELKLTNPTQHEFTYMRELNSYPRKIEQWNGRTSLKSKFKERIVKTGVGIANILTKAKA